MNALAARSSCRRPPSRVRPSTPTAAAMIMAVAAVSRVVTAEALTAPPPRTILVDSAGTTFLSTGFFGLSLVPSPILTDLLTKDFYARVSLNVNTAAAAS